MPSLRSHNLLALSRATGQQVKTAPAAKPRGYKRKPKPNIDRDIDRGGTSMLTVTVEMQLEPSVNETAAPTDDLPPEDASALDAETSTPTDDSPPKSSDDPIPQTASASHVEISESTVDAESSSPTDPSALEFVSAPGAETSVPTDDLPPEDVPAPDAETSNMPQIFRLPETGRRDASRLGTWCY